MRDKREPGSIGRALSGDLLEALLDSLVVTNKSVTISDATRPDHPLVYVNRAFEQLSGYRADEVLGRNCRFLQGDDRDQPGLSELRAALSEGRNARVELRNYRKDGTLFHNELYLTAVYNGPRLAHFVGFQNDISDLIALRESYREKALEYELTFELSGVGQTQADVDGRLTRVNRKFCEMLGYSEAELVGKNFLDLTHPEDRASNRTKVQGVVQGALAESSFDKRYLRKDGTVMWGSVSTSVLRRENAPDRLLATVTDVTDRYEAARVLEEKVAARTGAVRRLSRELQAAGLRERERLARKLHDELQQDLFAAQFSLKGLEARAAEGDPPSADDLAEVRAQLRAVNRAARAVTRELRSPVADGATLAEALASTAASALTRYGLEVDLEVPGDLPTPDGERLGLIVGSVNELLLNVAKHSGVSSARLEATFEGRYVISVSDRGRGFGDGAPPDGVPQGGTGFGLLGMRERLAPFGGDVRVDSGEGTRVTLCLSG